MESTTAISEQRSPHLSRKDVEDQIDSLYQAIKKNRHSILETTHDLRDEQANQKLRNTLCV